MKRSELLQSQVKNLRRTTWNDPVLSHVTAAACLSVLAAGLLYYVHAYLRAGQYWIANTDYRVFYAAAVAVRHHLNPFTLTIAWMHQYNAEHHIGVAFATKSYGYPPIFAILQVPLTILPVLQAAIVWDLCNVLFLLGALYALLRIADVRPSPLGLLVLMTAAVLIDPIRKELFVAQVDIFLLCLVCLALWARYEARPHLAGLLLGVACAVKPQLLLWLVFLLWKREFRFAATASVSFLVLFLAPFLWLGGHVWHDQLAVFDFWSNQYLAYDHNDSPKGVLVRLFTQNPVVRPLVAAPHLATVLWLLIAAVVLVLTLSRIAPCPLRRDTRSMLEIGLWVPAALLIAPLTEWPYLLVLAIPLLSIYAWLRNGNAPEGRTVALGSVAVWLALCGPLTQTENYLVSRMGTHSVVADLYVLLAPGYLYVLIAIFALQLHVLRLVSETSTRTAVRRLFAEFPSLGRAWLHDAAATLRTL